MAAAGELMELESTLKETWNDYRSVQEQLRDLEQELKASKQHQQADPTEQGHEEVKRLELKEQKLQQKEQSLLDLLNKLQEEKNMVLHSSAPPPALPEVQQQLQQLQQQQQRLEQKLEQGMLFEELFLQVVDYSEKAVTTAPSTVGFKTQLIDKYSKYLRSAAGDLILCMVTHQYLPKRFVIGAHLWKREWQDFMWVLDLQGGIDDVRNGLLLFKPIEWAFDTSQLCFKVDQFGTLVPHLLNDNLKGTRLIDKLQELCNASSSLEPPTEQEMQLLQQHLKVPNTQRDITFGDLPTFWLSSDSNRSDPEPFKRVLEFQARRAVLKARRKGWPHERPEFIAGTPSATREKVMSWLADQEAHAGQVQPSADDMSAALQQLT